MPTAEGGARLPVELRTIGTLNTSARSISLDTIAFTGGPLTVQGSISAEMNGEQPGARGQLTIEPFDLRAFGESLAMPLPTTADPEALRTAGLSVEFVIDGGNVAIAPVTLTLDDSTATGRMQIALGNPPAFDFDLEIDRLDADRYRPPETDASPSELPTLPLKTLRALDANGTLTIVELTAEGATFDNVRLELHSHEPAPGRGGAAAHGDKDVKGH